MEEVAVPHFFLCPISLEIMKDPVTVPTGITYDRVSIEKWLFSGKNATCPVTKQVISDCELTPNHTLRRLIQSWCTLNASYGVERIPTPKPPTTKTQLAKLLKETETTHQRVACLKKLRSISGDNETNKRNMEAAGAVDFLASMVNEFEHECSDQLGCWEPMSQPPSEEALSILYSLHVSDQTLTKLAGSEAFVDSLARIMRTGSYESRAYAVLMLKSVIEVADTTKLISLRHQLLVEVVANLKDNISLRSSKACLKLLIHVAPWGRNRVKTVEAGAVPALVDILLESSSRRPAEMAMTLLDLLCQCAEGRAALLGHSAGIAVVSKKILRVSQVGTERGVRILSSVARFSATPGVVQEMLQVGVVAKLCLVLQVDCANKVKDRAREVLRLHAKDWKDSPCLSPSLASSYP